MVTESPGASASLMLVMIVVSVGPYPLCTERSGPPSPSGIAHLVIRSAGTASPPATSTRRLSRPVGSMVASADGVMKACVTPSPRISSDSSSPPYTPVGTTTSAPPAPIASRNSRIEASKLGDAKCSARESESSAYRSACSALKLARPAWVTTTPLGRPVEPEV
ncbi:hypothetical protein NWFMUON74_64100 [Nocardia wallacei]|uniref:Uncharacterized protein n=1 Tax=Nocardia wallacei TaxID=480035 RepID=A0A7G1KTQ8_9NOCA|nr:hypothetical protein NWFMUON74_64100 [Nocardia wallacei]